MVANRLAFAPSAEGISVEVTPWLCESVAHEIDQLQIRLRARRVEGDKRRQQLLRCR